MAGRRSRNNDITVDILLRAYSAGVRQELTAISATPPWKPPVTAGSLVR